MTTYGVPLLDDVIGARQELTVVLPVRLKRLPDWPEGPFPFELGSRRTDAQTRSTYFAPASARALYGSPGRPCRWHLPLDVKNDGLHLLGMELLRAATARNPEHALVVLHLSVERPLLPILRALAGRRPNLADEPLTGPFDPAALLAGIADVRDPDQPFAIARPYTIAFITPTERHTPALRAVPEGALPATADAWLWQLASRSTPEDFPLPPETAAEQLKDAVRISADWSALVLRQGAAFLGHRPDTGVGDFFEFGALHSRTVYLDALLLGSLQRDHIDELTDELSEVFNSSRLARRVATLERNIAVFRSTYWRQHLTAHGAANDLLLAFQNQHRLPARFDEILAAYRAEVDKLVTEENFSTVDVVSLHPSEAPDWPDTAKAARERFLREHTHDDDDEVRFFVAGAGIFYLHVQGQVHAVYCEKGDLLGVPRGTTHWFDMGAVPSFTAIRFFHEEDGWIGNFTGSDIASRFPDFDEIHAGYKGEVS